MTALLHDVHLTASKFLNELERGGTAVAEVEVVERFAPSTYATESESAADFLHRVRRELATPSDRFEVEVEAPKFFLQLGRSRYFNGYLRDKPVFGFDVRLAATMSDVEVATMQRDLLRLGFETDQRLVVPQEESSL